MFQLLSILALNFKWYHWAVIGGIVFVVVLAGILMRVNTKMQMQVSFYMDDESGTYNIRGLEKYISKHTGKYKNATMICIEVKNLATIYRFHPNSTELMHEIADVFLKGLKKNDTIARVEFNKFVVLMDSPSQEDSKLWCKKKMEDINDPNMDSKISTQFELSFGMREKPDLKEAMISIEETMGIIGVSTLRDGNIYYYSPDVKNALEKSAMIAKFKDSALSNGEFVAYIQPKVSLRTGKVVGGEILCRWVNPDFSVRFMPGEFVPVFEKSGFIKEIDVEMFRQAAILSRNLSVKGMNGITVGVNVSKINFDSPRYIQRIGEIVKEVGAQPETIEIEITESSADLSSKYIANVIMQLKQLGFRLAMDDFGKEYSSIGLLANSPFDTIKMDQVFFKNGLTNEKDYTIAKNIINLLTKLNLGIVCEGVENKNTLNIISSISRDVIIQGYVYAKPIPVAEFEAFAKSTFDVSWLKEPNQEKEVIIVHDNQKQAAGTDVTIVNPNAKPDNSLDDLKNQIEMMKKMILERDEAEKERRHKEEVEALKEELNRMKQSNLQANQTRELVREINANNQRQIDEALMRSNEATKNMIEERLAQDRKEREELEALLRNAIANSNNSSVVLPEDKNYTQEEIDKTQKEADNKLDVSVETLSTVDTKDNTEVDNVPDLSVDDISNIIAGFKNKSGEDWVTTAKDELKDDYHKVIESLQYYQVHPDFKITFVATIKNASPEVLQIYNIVKNEFMKYDKVTNKLTDSYDVIYLGNKVIGKISLAKNKVNVYVAADPNDPRYAKFPHKDVSDHSSHKNTPYFTQIESQISFKRLKRILEHYMQAAGVKAKVNYKPIDYATKYKFYKNDQK